MPTHQPEKRSQRNEPLPIETFREVLAKPHYEMVETIGRYVRDGHAEKTQEIFASIAGSNATRAALVIADLYASSPSDSGAWREITKTCSDATWWKAVEESVSRLPVVDAHRFRVEMLGHEPSESMAKVVAAFVNKKSEAKMPPFRNGYDERKWRKEEVDAISSALESKVQGGGALVTTLQSLSGRALELCREFNERVAALHFPLEKYGYSTGARSLKVDKPATRLSRLSGENDGEVKESPRQMLARLASKVFVEWGASPDLPGAHGHQCVDSASAARSFFVARGVPCDVYLIGLGSITHNIAVAFFENRNGGYQPVVVDASPFKNSYRLSGPEAPAIWRPQTISDIYEVRKHSMPFAQGYFGGFGGGGGYLPWSCVEVKGVGILVGFAGIRDEHIKIRNRMIAGTDEFYGRGARVRAPALSYALIPAPVGGEPVPMAHLVVEERDKKVVTVEQTGVLSDSQKRAVLDVAKAQMPHLRKAIKGLDLQLGKVTV